MTLILYNGANSDQAADLDDGVTAAIARGGWPQKGPKPLTSDLWDDVEETVVVRLLTDSNAIYSTLMLLARRAEEVQSPTHKDHLNPAAWVIVKAKTPGEFAPRWALVKDIRVEKLDPAHYRADGRTSLEVKFVREGTWRGIEPGEQPITLLAMSNIDFWEPIDLPEISGDAPPDAIFRVKQTGINLIAVSRFESWLNGEDAPEFSPYVFASEAASGTTLIDISSLGSPFNAHSGPMELPGGKCVYIPPTNETVRWSVDLDHYTGKFDVYGLFLHGYSGTAWAQLQLGWENGGLLAAGDSVDIPNSNSGLTDANMWHMVKLGTTRLPSSGERLYGEPPYRGAYYGAYQIAVFTGASVVDNAYLGGVVLVPFPDYPPQILDTSASSGNYGLTAVANGELRRFYTTSDDGELMSRVADGPYQSLRPGADVINRVHVIPLPVGSGLPWNSRFPSTTNWQFSAAAIPRWQYLNQLPAAPTALIHTSPPAYSTDENAEFTYSADRPGCTFQCRLDGSPWATCTSPTNYFSLSDGVHQWTIRATSEYGVTGEPVTYTWDIDTGGPF